LIVGGSKLYSTDLIEVSEGIAIASIIFGSFLLVTCILGVYGVFREKTKFLVAYLVLLMVLIICQVSVGIAAFANRNNLYNILQQYWGSYYNQNNNSPVLQQIEQTVYFIYFS
jgi:hypothetical protein